MALYGNIISIEYLGSHWVLVIDGKKKEFPSYEAIHRYLLLVLKKAEDKEKLKLLKKDVNKLIKGGHGYGG